MKKITSLIIFLLAFLSFPPFSFAASVSTCPVDDFAGLCNLNFSNIIPALVTTIFIIAIVVALLYLIWGGFKWLTSGGDKAAVQSAREHIVAAIVGLVLIFSAYFILNIALNFFIQKEAGEGFTLPTIGGGSGGGTPRCITRGSTCPVEGRSCCEGLSCRLRESGTGRACRTATE